MTHQYRITPRAYEDLKEIGRYTERNWGRQQRNTYLSNLVQHFQQLASEPGLGKHRPEIAEGYFSFPAGSHIIFYQKNQQGIAILGLPHKQMDLPGYFSSPKT